MADAATTTKVATEAQIFTHLKNDLQTIDELVDVLSDEAVLFQRSMYKNHSQHRRAFFYQNLQQNVSIQVKRCLRDTKLASVKELFREANSVLAQLEVQPGMHHVSWKVLSSDLKVQTDMVLRKLVIVATDSSEVIAASQKAYKGLSAQFGMTYFMPFTLMMNAILGRISLLFKTLLTRAIEAHGAIALLYLNEVTKANPLRAKVTAVQLRGYQIPAEVIQIANV